MTSKAIDPQQINKPIQLLAAWLLGLITIDGVFLTAATMLDSSSLLPNILVVAAVVNVPIFIICLFILQTKFRPEMQEDHFYTKYLEYRQQTGTQQDINKEIYSLKESVFDINNKMFEIMRNIQSQISDIVPIVETQKQDEISVNISEGKQIISMATKSQTAIDQIAMEAKWKMINVQVNDLLPNFKEILRKLSLNNINVYDTFGSTSESRFPPYIFELAFGLDIPVYNIQKILEFMSDLGLQAISYTNHEINRGEIYIGAYGSKKGNYTTINDDLLRKLLDDKLSIEEFTQLVISNY